MRLEALGQWEIEMISPGMKPTTALWPSAPLGDTRF
jgi:hypothetical protein